MAQRIVFSIRGNPRTYSAPAPRAYSELGEHMVQSFTRQPFVFSEVSDSMARAVDILSSMAEGPGRERDIVSIPMYKAEGDVGECSICMENIKKDQQFRRLPCSDTVNHCFHRRCIDQWLATNSTCPNCRSEIG